MRVLHVIPSVSVHDGGPTVALGLMERCLAEAGLDVTTLTTDHGLASVGPAAADGVQRVYARAWFTPYKVAPGMVGWLASSVRSFDVVHIHALFSFSSTVAAWAARTAGVPYVLRPLGTLGRYGMTQRRAVAKRWSLHLVERANLARAAAVHFTTAAEMEEARELGIECRGVVIPIGVEAGQSVSALGLVRPQIKALGGRYVILFLSRIDPKKNTEALIDAFAGSADLRAKAALVVAGDGDPAYVAGLKARAAQAGLDDTVIWLGHVEGEEKAAAFAGADAFVLPSFSENFGIAAVEAMMARRPCILSPGVAVAPNAARDGAVVIGGPDALSLARSIEALMAEPQRARTLAERGRAHADRLYSPSAMTAGLLALYREIAAPRAVSAIAAKSKTS